MSSQDTVAAAAAASAPPAPVNARPAPGGGAVGRLISRPLFWVITLALLFGLPLARSMMRRLNPPPPVLSAVPAFNMTDQLGRPFGSKDLVGQVWVADFIFTSCQTMCPLLTEKLAEIGKRARHLGPTFHLVSFSVDPERDTPERLKAYAAAHGADAHKWSFLTGSMESVQHAVVDGFKIGVDRHKTADDFWEIVHGEHLVVVDRRLQIRGYFDASPEGMDKLVDA
ncbi:MAG: SCO family protein, partial [Polyangia bacterium]